MARNAVVRRISTFNDIYIEKIEFVGQGIESGSEAIDFYGARNVTIANCEFKEFGHSALYLCDYLDCVIEHCAFRNVFMTGLGYSVSMGNACDNIVIRDNSFFEMGRHYIAVGGSTGTVISGGLCRHVDVTVS